MDFIQGQKFESLGQWAYAPIVRHRDDYDKLKNVFDFNAIENGDIIYTHSFYVKQLFKVLGELDKGVIVVTHNSDINIDNSFSPPDNVFKWFSQNVNVIHEKIESIPIGLENDRWFPQIRKKEKMGVTMGMPKFFKNLVYMNHNINTNPGKRNKPYELLEKKRWVTTEHRANGENFDDYLQNLFTHKFVICPEGNGLDTHRTWEALYMGAIPIEIKNNNNRFYADLPILVIDDWEQLTEKFLEDWYYQMMCGIKVWNYDKLNFSYWEDKILNTR